MPASRQIIVNAHYLADQIEEFCAAYPNVKVLRETELQETGGALTAMAAKNLLARCPVLRRERRYLLGGRPERCPAPHGRCL